MEQCSKEKEINEIWKKLDKLDQAIYRGNGKKSIQESIISIESNFEKQNIINDSLIGQLETLNTNTERMGTALSGILKFQNEYTGEQKAKTKYITNIKWTIGVFVTVVIALVGWIIMIKT